MIPLLEQHRDEIARLCGQFGVRRIDVFGSAAKGDFDPATSDVDFVVEFADTSPGLADRYLAFADALETLLARRVDLVTERSIRNPIFRREIERDRQCIYEQRGEQAAA